MIIITNQTQKEELYIITARVDGATVKIKDNDNRSKTISAGKDYKVGDSVLVVSGVLVRKVATDTIKTIKV